MRLLTFLLALALSVSCGSSEETGRDKIVYGGSSWYGHAPIWAGIKLGIFKNHGFDLTAGLYPTSSDRLNAIEAGNVTFASLGEVAMLGAMVDGRTGFLWIANHNIAPGNEGLVGIGIDSIKDLKGKTIALQLNTSIHLTVALLLKDNGMSFADVTIKNGTNDAIVQMVRNGDAHAGAMWEPHYSDLQALPNAKVLGTDKDTSIYKQFQTMSGPDVVCASRKWVEADPARAKRLFKAYFEAVQWCADNPEELIDIAVEHTRKDRAVVKVAMKNFTWIGWNAQKVNMSDARMYGQAQIAAEMLVEMGQLKSVPKFRDWTYTGMYFD